MGAILGYHHAIIADPKRPKANYFGFLTIDERQARGSLRYYTAKHDRLITCKDIDESYAVKTAVDRISEAAKEVCNLHGAILWSY